ASGGGQGLGQVGGASGLSQSLGGARCWGLVLVLGHDQGVWARSAPARVRHRFVCFLLVCFLVICFSLVCLKFFSFVGSWRRGPLALSAGG
ncbi:hypothetical protein, partial [Mycolicibacter arupensis]|uniref:hypothetical protein n=1 Tax=Mycolicibacter arupensis TaxID=342002 RepID=UPI001F30A62D